MKNVTKFVMPYSAVKLSFGGTFVTADNGERRITCPYPTEETINKLFLRPPNAWDVIQKNSGPDILQVIGNNHDSTKFINTLRKHFQALVPLDIDNLVVLEFLQLGYAMPIQEKFFESLYQEAARSSIQELAQIAASIRQLNYEQVVNFTYTTPGDCYVFSINPALVVVLNHQSFPNRSDLNSRSASSKDVQCLKKVFTQKKIKYVILKDGSLEDVKKLMRKVRSLRFTGLRHLFFVVMSHGDEGDIIYTKTGSYSIRDDIVAPLFENPSLADTHITVLVNACRGGIDPRDVDCQAIATLAPSPREPVIYPKASNLVLMFSTQPGWISLRFDVGAIFIQEFCKVFGGDFAETTMERIGSEVKERMEYELSALYDCVQTPDYISQDDAWRTSIRVQFVNFFKHHLWRTELFEFLQKCFALGYIDINRRQLCEAPPDIHP